REGPERQAAQERQRLAVEDRPGKLRWLVASMTLEEGPAEELLVRFGSDLHGALRANHLGAVATARGPTARAGCGRRPVAVRGEDGRGIVAVADRPAPLGTEPLQRLPQAVLELHPRDPAELLAHFVGAYLPARAI